VIPLQQPSVKQPQAQAQQQQQAQQPAPLLAQSPAARAPRQPWQRPVQLPKRVQAQRAH
jgi:hypothetical protein